LHFCCTRDTFVALVARQAFTLSDTVVSVAVLGATGAVGKHFIKQLNAQKETIMKSMGIDVKVQVLASSS
jgi:hypothetical protein